MSNIRCEVIERFNIGDKTIKEYGDIKCITEMKRNKDGNLLFMHGDIFECTEKMARYLQTDNNYTKKER